MKITGIQKTSLIDYPDKVSAIIFTPGCNFRCGFCHNASLVKDPGSQPEIPEQELLGFLSTRKKWLDGIVVTGGEPTLHAELPEFLRKVKSLGFLVKLDTNGSNPGMVKELIDSHLVDYIAMDIKSSQENYAKAVSCDVNLGAVKETAKLIMGSGIDYEFRATVLPEIFSLADAKAVGEWLHGAKAFCLQQFSPHGDILDPAFKEKAGYTKKQLNQLREELAKHIEKVEIRS